LRRFRLAVTGGDNPAWTVSSWFFLRGLGVIYLIAFASLWPQLDGLIGPDGILPASSLLKVAQDRLGPERYWLLPTLLWLDSGEAMLHGLCAAGCALALLVVADVAPAVCLMLLWAFYLSLVSVGREFLSFQWDALLLETGFLAVLLAPLRLRPSLGRAPAPSWVARWLLQWLLFRLMFSSGAVKLASEDPVWRNLKALTYHYQTQPLPTWIGWYAHQLPGWWHRFSCGVMFVIELAVPLLIFGPRSVRRVACGILIAFQVLILATGNYGYFNWLTILLCVLLIDDDAWPSRVRKHICSAPPRPVSRPWPRWLLWPLAAGLFLASLVQFIGTVGSFALWPSPVLKMVQALQPLRTVNSYGLFAVMTTTRREIVIEGSRDGTHWETYEFKYKPGSVTQRPRFVAPHQPRLDWQMWFAALGDYRQSPWLLHLCGRLLEGSKPIRLLLATDPFPNDPPTYVRATVYDYGFTDWITKRRTGTWWRRKAVGLYCPILTRDQR
jgi:hypothetical protein